MNFEATKNTRQTDSLKHIKMKKVTKEDDTGHENDKKGKNELEEKMSDNVASSK